MLSSLAAKIFEPLSQLDVVDVPGLGTSTLNLVSKYQNVVVESGRCSAMVTCFGILSPENVDSLDFHLLNSLFIADSTFETDACSISIKSLTVPWFSVGAYLLEVSLRFEHW